jgi:probable F420-dependent oxidoreductase
MIRPFRFGQLAMLPPPDRAAWIEQVQRAEALGYSTIQVTDHTDRTPMAPLVALAAAAQVSTTLRLGTLVLANDFRQPAVLAKEVATLDLLSDGRVELGMGAGWLQTDYDQAGIELLRPGLRIDRLTETLDVLDGFATGAPTTYRGTHYSVTDLPSVPPPVQRPRVPLLVGGGGRRVLTIAAQRADIVGVNLMNAEGFTGTGATRSALEDATDAKIALVRKVAAAAGRDPELHLVAYWAEIADDVEAAVDRQIQKTGMPISPAEVVTSPHCLIGPLGAVRERLHELRERWGITYISIHDRNADGCTALVETMTGR